MEELLRYRRQFLIADRIIPELSHWQHRKWGTLHLFAHPDLDITVEDHPPVSILLIGYILDPENPEKTNKEIVSDLIKNICTFSGLIANVKRYVGRYAIAYRDKDICAIFHDPFGLREIYYCTQPNRILCGSQPNLINKFSNPRLGITRDLQILHFYENDLKLVRSGRAWIGDETYFHGVKHLMSNDYLDFTSLTPHRYWPNRRLDRVELDIAVKLCSDYLKGVIKAATSRYKVMMAVTSGIDSRSLLAASRDVYQQIYYFINKKPPLTENSPDIYIPKRIFASLGIPFHVHEVRGSVDEEFKRIFLDNTFMSTDLLLRTIYNVYYKNHQDKVNLLGVGEIGRGMFGLAPQNITGYYLAHKLKYRKSSYVTKQCEKWLRENKEIAEAYNVDLMALFIFWALAGNWSAVGNSESDIAIEEFNPYDSHFIYETMLSLDWAHRALPNKRGIPDFYERLFETMWPALLDFPFNPPHDFNDRIIHYLRRIGLYNGLQRIKYNFDNVLFNKLAGI